MSEIPVSHRMRTVGKHGSSIGVTIPVEFGFSTGDAVIWDIIDNGVITLSKIDVTKPLPRHTEISRQHRKNALYAKIDTAGELVKEDYLMARFAIEYGISRLSLDKYRDELLEEGVIERVGDTLQSANPTPSE